MPEPTITQSDRDDVRMAAGKTGVQNLTEDEINTALTRAIGTVVDRTAIPWTDTTNYYNVRLNLWRLFAAVDVLKGKNSLVDTREELRKEIRENLNEIFQRFKTPEERDKVYIVGKERQSFPWNQRGMKVYGKSRFTKRVSGTYY